MKAVLSQAGLVLMVGALLSLAANAVSPRGLKLTTDYFPKPKTATAAAVAQIPPPATPGTNDPLAAVTARLRAQGLQPLPHSEVLALFQSPDTATQKVIFVDARDDQHYQAGHVPGAWQFDRYRPENYLPTLLNPCLSAEKIVVYCNGGECEDSEFAAQALTQSAGVPAQKIFIYAGGFAEWETRGQPLETGVRGSGTFRPAKQ